MNAEIIHGDCLDVMRGMHDASVDGIITDPPYGLAYVSAWRKRSNDVTVPVAGDEAFDPTFHAAWMREAFRILKDGCALYSFSSDHHLGAFRSAFADAGFRVKRTLVWVKNAWTSGDLEGDYGHQTEFIVFATKGRHIIAGARRSNVLDFRRVPPNALVHSCQKPPSLLATLMDRSVAPGGFVFDPFCGSAQTGVACTHTGRRFVGVEIDAGNVATARRELSMAGAQTLLGVA
jgi:DNA modification methylase